MSNSSSSFMKPIDFDASKINYSELKSMGTTAKQMYVNYNTTERVAFTTPKMRIPFGINIFEEEGKNPKYSLDLSLDGIETDPKIKAFHDAILSLEQKIMKDAKKNSLAWLKKKNVSDELIKTLFSSAIKYSKDKDTGEINTKYAPTFKGKLPYWEGKMKTIVFDHNRSKLEGDIVNNFTKGRSITSIVKCSGVWFSGGKFGMTWQFEQIKLDKPSNLIGYAFRGDDEDM